MVESKQTSYPNFLPKHSKQFQDQEFWSEFFKAKKTTIRTGESKEQEAFEWYAEYEDLEPILKEVVGDDQKKILIPGCGDSSLSGKLSEKLGQQNITSIDFEPDVIEKMQKKGHEGVSYLTMDFLNLQFEDKEFDLVIDKGSFDALCCDQTEETGQQVLKYLGEVARVLGEGGKYLCISLLQDFVLQALLNFFEIGKDNPLFGDYSFEFQVCKVDKVCTLESSRFQPFLITVTKNAKNDKKTKIELQANNGPETLKSGKTLKDKIKVM